MSDPSGSTFQSLFEAALEGYEEQTGKKLIDHPLAKQLEQCNSVESITAALQEQAQAFNGFRRFEGKVMKPFKGIVHVLHTLSTNETLRRAINLSLPPATAITIALAFLLGAIKDVSASYNVLVEVLDSMERFLSRLDIYIKLPLVTPTSAMGKTIVKIVVELLSALALVTKQIKQNRPIKLIKKLLGEKDIENVLHRLDRLTLDEARDTGAQTLEVVYGLVANTRLILDGEVTLATIERPSPLGGEATADGILDKVLDGIQNSLKTMQDVANKINKSQREELLKNAREWIHPPDPWENHDAARESHHRGTSTWFVQGNAYMEWKSSRDSPGSHSHLWIHAKPGAGKSILCSTIIEDIDYMRRRGLASLAFFYCDFRIEDKKCLRGLLSSLLEQFCCLSNSYSDILSNFYSEYNNGSRHPSDKALFGCLERMLKHPGQAPIYIIIDGLDECPNIDGRPSPRGKVLKFVEELVDLQQDNLHICITSRLEADINNSLGRLPFNQISLDTESGQMQDIIDYVKSVIDTDEEMKGWQEADKKYVFEALTKKSDSMFRWVFCQFELLSRCLPAQIRGVLREMPKSLDGTYERILQGIHEVKWKYARRLFQCVAVASRPLRDEELAGFLAFDLDVEATPAFRADKRPGKPLSAVLSTCSSLLAVVKRGRHRFIQFSHSSVIEYLMSTRLSEAEESISRYHISMAPAHTVMVQACLDVLLDLDEREITRDGLKNFPIVEYAAKYWVDHARSNSVSANTQDAMKRLFDPRRPHLAVWLWIYNPTISWQARPERPTQPEGSCLHYAACLGFHDLIMFLLSECSPDVNARGLDDMTALHWASRGGHSGIAQALLERGADVRIQDKKKWTSLRYALDKGHIEVARVLLENGAETSPQGMDGWIPLCWASRHGHVEVARLLLEYDVDASFQDKHESTPLHLASEAGHVEVVRVLLDYGVVVRALDGNKSSAVHLASKGGHVEVVQLLMEHNADVNVEDKEHWKPLWYALDKRHMEVARLLLEHGADTNAQGKYEWIPLHSASRDEYVDIVQLLLKYGGDANLQDKHESTALHLASQNGCVEVARLLLEHGIDASARNESKSTPLHLASQNGRVEVARLLLEHGIDASARNENKSTPLHLASEGGHVELAQLLLLQHDVDPSAQDVNKWTPLHWASRGGHVEVARVLLQCGADAKAEDADKWTPLHLLSGDGQVEVARLVLGRGVDTGSRGMVKLFRLYQHLKTKGHVGIPPEHSEDVNCQDLSKWARLEYSNRGSALVELVRVLLEKGADVNAQDKNDSTPLHWASGCGLVDLARVLLENDANARAQDKDKSTPLHRVSEYGQIAFVGGLLQRDNHRVFRPSYYSGQMCGELAKLLLTHNADVGAQNKDKFSPLHLASGGAGLGRALPTMSKRRWFGDSFYSREESRNKLDMDSMKMDSIEKSLEYKLVGLVRVLLTNGADVRAQDKDDSTPLHWTSGGGYMKLSRALLKGGEDEFYSNRWNQRDVERIYVDVAQELLEHGADAVANVQDISGLTPLQQAQRVGFIKVARLLSSHSATPQESDDYMDIDYGDKRERSDYMDIDSEDASDEA